MKNKRRILKFFGALAALSCTAAHASPIITQVVETGGDNEATDTITAKFTGETVQNGIAGEFQNPYVVPTFGEDVYSFVDRAHQWNGITADMPLPSYLVGGEYIMIGNDNRDNPFFRLDITVSEPVIVYLLIDNRLGDASAGDPPEFGAFPTDWTSISWVGSDGYQPVMTGLNRNQDPSIPDEVAIDGNGDGVGPGVSVADYSSVYSRQVEAGTFSVYEANNANQNMYGVVVKRVPGSLNSPPEISNFTPTNNALFYNPAGGLSFTATTVSPNNITPANVVLFLNGTNVSTQLAVSGSGTSRNASFTNLAPNTLYNARIVVSDQAGRATTNSFVFDTFNEASALTIEAEDYNYGGGQFQDGTTPNGYDSLAGTPEVDFHDINSTIATMYRISDPVGIATAGDILRSPFANGAIDYAVNGIYAGDWLNYTRAFPSNNYNVFLRASATAAQQVRLDLVSGGATTTNQTKSALGVFNIPSGVYGYAPLADGAGNPITITLSGTETVRLTSLGGNSDLQMNDLIFVPAGSSATPAYVSTISPAPGSTSAAPDALLRITIANGSTQFAPGSAVLTFNGAAATPSITSTNGETILTFDPPGTIPPGTNIPVTLVFKDTAGATISNSWSFAGAQGIIAIPANFATPIDSGLGDGFRIHIHKASNDAGTGTPPALAQTVDRAEQQLNGTLIDPLTGAPYENEAGGPDGTGLLTNAVVNFQQLGNPAGFIPGDTIFPNIDPDLFGDPNNIAMEATAYLQLTAGTHRFGVVSDDGFRVSTGPVLTNANDIVLGIFDAGRGDGLPAGATEFSFYVPQDGLYPFRLLYDEGQGGASVEFYSLDPDTFQRILINDRTNPKAVKAYTGRSVQVFVPTISITSPTNTAAFPAGPTNVNIMVDAALQGGQVSKVEFFSGTNKLGESTAQPFSFTLNNVQPGHYTLYAKATGDNGLSAASGTVEYVVGTPLVSINFEIATTETPEGYLPDYGDVFGDRGNGYNYGWDVDNTANARERNSPDSPSKLYDTFTHMQKPLPAGRVWEITLPNGRYNVYGGSGDITATDSTFDVQAEGVTFIQGTPTASQHFSSGMAAVTVSDGELTISNGPLAVNSKIDFLDIFALGADTTAPTLGAPVISGGNFTVTWTGGGTLQSTTSLAEPITWTDLESSGTHTEAVSGTMKFFRVRK